MIKKILLVMLILITASPAKAGMVKQFDSIEEGLIGVESYVFEEEKPLSRWWIVLAAGILVGAAAAASSDEGDDGGGGDGGGDDDGTVIIKW